MVNYQDIIDFWFEEITPNQWWIKDAKFDDQITSRFERIYQKAIATELYSWRDQPLGRLAEIIVLDQFPRNMYRGTAKAFASDSLALCLSQEALRNNTHKHLKNKQISFLFMPFMHSESKEIHVIAEQLFSQPELIHNKDFELKHKAIIDKFGRYPHRNEILGRASSPEEIEFLTQPNSSF